MKTCKIRFYLRMNDIFPIEGYNQG